MAWDTYCGQEIDHCGFRGFESNYVVFSALDVSSNLYTFGLSIVSLIQYDSSNAEHSMFCFRQ